MTLMQTVVVTFVEALAGVIVVDSDAVVDSAYRGCGGRGCSSCGCGGWEAVVAGVLNSDLVSSSELH